MLLACLTIVPITLLHCLWVSGVEIGCAGLRIVLILLFMCIGFCSWSVEAYGFSLAVLLHSFRSFASLLICLSPALDIGGLGCVMVVVTDLGVCIGQIWVAMSWYSWIIVMTCAAA